MPDITDRTQSRQSSTSTLSPSTHDSLYSWSRSVHMSRSYLDEQYRPSSSSRSGRVPSGETATSATSIWSEDGGETVAPSHEKYSRPTITDVDEEYDAKTEGDLIQLYSDNERQRQQRKTPRKAAVQPDESLLDSQAEYSGLRADDADGQYVEDVQDAEESEQSEGEGAGSPLGAELIPAPTPGDKLRQLLAQMHAQSDLHRDTAKASSPTKTIATLPSQPQEEQHPSRSYAREDPDRRKTGSSMRYGIGGSSAYLGTGQGRQAEAGPSSPRLKVRQANWREGRRIGVVPPASPPRARRGAPGTGADDAGGEEEGDDSPPTPPMRILNPFAMSARRREQNAALMAEQEGQRSRSPQHLKSALETYIAHHPSIPPPVDSSSSALSGNLAVSASGSSSSRKGKERERLPQSDTLTPMARPTSTRPSGTIHKSNATHTTHTARKPRPPPTPRRSSVDMAPDDSALFAQEAEGLEVPVGMLDVSDDMSGIAAPWEVDDGAEGMYGAEEGPDVSAQGGSGRNYGRSENGGNRSKESSGRDDSGRLSRLLKQSQQGQSRSQGQQGRQGEASRGHAPDRDEARMGDTRQSAEYEFAQYEGASASISSSHRHQPSDSIVPNSSPIRVGMTAVPKVHHGDSAPVSAQTTATAPSARTSRADTSLRTPAKASHNPRAANPNYSNMATPHPPGWLSSSPLHPVTITKTHTHPSPARSVRFSPLRKTDADWSNTESSLRTATTGDGSRVLGRSVGQESANADAPRVVDEHDAQADESSLYRIRLKGSPRAKGKNRSGRESTSFERAAGAGSLAHTSGSNSRLRTPINAPCPSKSSPLRDAATAYSDLHSMPTRKAQPSNDDTSIDPDSSFALRLLAPLSRFFPSPLPKRSTTYATAAPLIRAAEEETAQAQEKVKESQRLWMEAVGVLQRIEGRAKGMMRDINLDGMDGMEVLKEVKAVAVKGVGWGWWVWWVLCEVLLMWAVFRITIEYAHPTLLNTLSIPDLALSRYSSLWPYTYRPSSSRAFSLAVPLPHGLSAFVVRQSKSSVNFFDLLERADFWLTGLSQSRMQGVSEGWGGGRGVPS